MRCRPRLPCVTEESNRQLGDSVGRLGRFFDWQHEAFGLLSLRCSLVILMTLPVVCSFAVENF